MTLLGPPVIQLYLVSGVSDEVIDAGAKGIYGERISASFNEFKTFLLTLRNLEYNDTGTFELGITMKRGSDVKLKNGKITLRVQGMLHIICFSCFREGKGEY